MTVGQPETNLDTWGLRYVKKTSIAPSAKPSSTTTVSNIDTPSRSSNIDVGSKPATEMRSHGGRQNDSAGDKDVKIVGHAGRESGHTPEVATQIQSPKEGKFGVGSSAPEGATHHVGSGKVMSTGKYGKPKTDKKTGKQIQSNPDVHVARDRAQASGESASHTSGIRAQNVDRLAGAYDKRTQEQRESDKKENKEVSGKITGMVDEKGEKLKPSEGKSKPQKRGTPEGSKTGGATPKIKAALDYAIIQCQLLKMNNITKGWFSDEIQTGKYGKPDRVAPDPKKSPDKQSVKEPRSTVNNERKDETEVTSYGEGATGKHGKQGDKKLNVGGKVVDTNNERPRTSVKSDDVVAKAIELINVAYDEMNKAHELGEGDKQSDFQWHKGDSSDLLRTDKPERTAEGKRSKKPHNYGEGDAERVGRADNIENRPTNEYNSDRKIKDGGDSGTATTSTEGTTNFVYSDVKEKKKQEEMDEDDYREMKRDRARSSTAHENVPE